MPDWCVALLIYRVGYCQVSYKTCRRVLIFTKRVFSRLFQDVFFPSNAPWQTHAVCFRYLEGTTIDWSKPQFSRTTAHVLSYEQRLSRLPTSAVRRSKTDVRAAFNRFRGRLGRSCDWFYTAPSKIWARSKPSSHFLSPEATALFKKNCTYFGFLVCFFSTIRSLKSLVITSDRWIRNEFNYRFMRPRGRMVACCE